MILDCRAIAKELLSRTKERALLLPSPPRVVALVGRETPATLSYLKIKTARAVDAGCVLETRPLPAGGQVLAQTADADAVIVQLPLPSGVNQAEMCDAIPLAKDADVLSSAARAKFERGEEDALLPPVVSAVQKIMEFANVPIVGKKAVVVGEGFLVGAPVAVWLRQQGAEVTVLHIKTIPAELSAALSTADIIVSGAGSPHFIKPNMIKEGVVLVDAGTAESNGVIVGDADPSCAAKCSLFTPVPGGVGPLAVACLFENAVTLAERSMI